MPERGRVDRAAAYVLHAYPYSETSLIVEAFTRRFGRVALGLPTTPSALVGDREQPMRPIAVRR